MKINEIIAEGVWDNLKTAGQTIKQGAGTMGQGIKQGANAVGQGVKQGAGAVANKVGQTYQQTMQARQQRFDQQAAQEFPGSKIGALGKEYSSQQQLKARNAGTFMGDVAKTIAGASPSTSYFTKATNTIGKKIPVGAEVEVPGTGKFKMGTQGWTDEKNQPVTDPSNINLLNTYYYGHIGQPSPSVSQTPPPPPPPGKSPGPNYIWNGSLWVPK